MPNPDDHDGDGNVDDIDDLDDKDFISEADMAVANAVLNQLELWPEKEPGPSPAGKAKFVAGSASFSTLLAKGRIHRVGKESSETAMLEVLPGSLRLTTYRGALTCRATIRLDPAKMAVPSGGLRVDVPLRVLQGIDEYNVGNQPLNCSVDLGRKQLTIETGRSSGETGRRRLCADPTRKRLTSATGRTNGKTGRRFCIEVQPTLRADAIEQDFPLNYTLVNGHSLSRVLRMCRSALDPRAKGNFSVVSIENGTARGGNHGVVLVVREPALADLCLSVPVRHCGHVAQIASHMQTDGIKMFESTSHIMLRDDIVELAILKSTLFPPIDALAKIAPQVSVFVDLEKFHTEVWNADLGRHFTRLLKKRKASATRQGHTATKALQSFIELQRTESELGLRIQGSKWIGHFYIPGLDFALGTLDAGRNPGSERGEETAAKRTRDNPEVWGKVDSFSLERVCRAIRPYQTATLGHCGEWMKIEINDPRCMATAYLPYFETADERFEGQV